MENVRHRCGPAASQLRARGPWPSDTELAPLAFSRARFPCSLDGLCCWCQVVCIPGCDRPLSKDEAEPSPWQPTAELVDGALNSAHGAAVGPCTRSTALATRVQLRAVQYGRWTWQLHRDWAPPATSAPGLDCRSHNCAAARFVQIRSHRRFGFILKFQWSRSVSLGSDQ